VQSQVRFNRVLEKVLEKASEMHQVRFNRVPEKVPVKVMGSLGAKPSQVQQKVPGGFGAESSSTGFRRRFRRFRRRSGVLWHRARSGSTGFRRRFPRRFRRRCGRLWFWRRFREAFRFNRVSEKVPEKVWTLCCRARSGSTGLRRRFRRRVPGSLGGKPSQVQRVPEKVAEAKPGQVHLTHANPAEVFPALGFPARFRKICKNKILRLLGIPRDTTEAYPSSSPDFRYHG